MKAYSSFVKRIKRWWFDEENLFRFGFCISPFDFSFKLITLLFDFTIGTHIWPFYGYRVKTIFSKKLRFNKNNSGDIELWLRNDLKTGIFIEKSIHCNHSPFNLKINILGFTLDFWYFDRRYWDDDNDRYEEDECECVDCDLVETWRNNMDIFEIDFDEKLFQHKCFIVFYDDKYFHDDILFTDDEYTTLISQANAIINDNNENPEKQAEACERKFQLLKTQCKLAPKLLDKALELCPDMPEALRQKGCFYLLTKNKEKAMDCFNNVIETSPSYPYVWLEKATLEKDIEKKLEYYTEFIRLKPDSKIGYESRCSLYKERLYEFDFMKMKITKQNDLQKAKSIIQQSIDDLTKLININPSNYIYYKERAELFIRNDMANYSIESINQNAIEDIKKALTLFPKEYIEEKGLPLHHILHDIHNMLEHLPEEVIKKCFEKMNKLSWFDDLFEVPINFLLSAGEEYDILETD